VTLCRTATRAELDQILNWAADEGWNPGLDDAGAFYAADPKGFFVAIEDGHPVASISVVNHTDDFAFLGLYIAHPDHRGKGIGFDLWQRALDHAGQRTFGLDGVAAQRGNYEASGFRMAGGTTRFTGQIAPMDHDDIRVARPSDTAELIAAEAAATGIPKSGYLGAWFQNTPTRQTLIAKRGFCTVRQCRTGAKIGPLLAEDTNAARALIQQAATRFDGPMTIDVPDSSDKLIALCRSFDMDAGFETARMYRGAQPVIQKSTFAVTTLELG